MIYLSASRILDPDQDLYRHDNLLDCFLRQIHVSKEFRQHPTIAFVDM